MTKKNKSKTKNKKSDPFADREAQKYSHPIPSREFIITHLKELKKPKSFQDLFESLRLSEEHESIALKRRIKAMVRDGQLERLRGGHYWPAACHVLIQGKVLIEKKPQFKVWVVPNESGPRVLLPSYQAQALSSGDEVVVSVPEYASTSFSRKRESSKGKAGKFKDKKSSKASHSETPKEGRVIEVISSKQLRITGRFIQEKGLSSVIPHGKDFTQDILIPAGKEKGAQNGEIVIVQIDKESTQSQWSEPLGEVVEVLGHEDKAGIEIEASIRAYELPTHFSREIEEEMAELSSTIPKSALKDRLDLRDLPFVTIDGEDAKDFDDAVYCEPRQGGGWNLYVAIADVSFYVRPGTPLDSEARLRGNSVYFPGRVIPMLPEALSNELCSLKPKVDRLTMVCELAINKAGKVTRYDFHEGVICSQERLTYTKVAALLQPGNQQLKETYQHVLPHLQELEKLYRALKEEREIRGAIEFETIETRIIFDNNSKITRIEPVVRNDAHRIIEECMLCANVATAKFLKKHKLPGLYRNHEGPQEDKLADLKLFLNELGLTLGGGKNPTPLDYSKLLNSIQKRPDVNVIQTVLLRSLSQAVYAPENVGHFGLAYPAYCHFTSPIRRYPDLLVHRQIRMLLQGKWDPAKHAKQEKEIQKQLEQLGVHTSATERRADEATREAIRWLKCEYIQKHVGDSFDGIISGVTRFGFFVELNDIYIDGLVHVMSLKDDYYYFDAAHHRLVGERLRKAYRLGDTVKVTVSKVNIEARRIDFELVGSSSKVAPRPTPRKEKPKKRRRRRG